ncbi:MAG: hypothetical protein V1492_01330 [Candidatus Micrarchaeota archaeon]
MKVNLFLVLVFGILAVSITSAAPTDYYYTGSMNQIVNVSENFTTFPYDNVEPLTLVLNDIEQTTHNALITLVSYNGNMLSFDEIPEGKTVTKTVAGRDISITVHETAASSASGVRWANITLKVSAVTVSLTTRNLFIYYINDRNVGVSVDDIEVGTRDAIISTPYGIEKVKEGANVVRNFSGKFYKVTVMQTSLPIYDWSQGKVKIKIEPANSGQNFDDYEVVYVQDYTEYDIGGAITRVYLSDLETETRSAIVTLTDGLGNVLANDKIKEGQTLVRSGNGGYRYQIKLIKMAAGAAALSGNYQGAWAKFDIVPNVATTESPSYDLVYLNSFYGSAELVMLLRDFEKDTRKAYLIIGNTSDSIYTEKIGEGQTFVRNVLPDASGGKYSIKVVQTATGYSYLGHGDPNAAWAKVVVQPAVPTAAISPALPPAEVLYSGGGVVFSGDGNISAVYDGIETPSHDLSLHLADEVAAQMLNNEKIKQGGSAVRNISTGNRYQIKVYETMPAYYNPAGNSWAKINITPTTATPPAQPTMLDFRFYPAIQCPVGPIWFVRIEGFETDTHKAIFSVRENTWDGLILIQDKITTGSTASYTDPVFGTCKVKVLQTFDDPSLYNAGAFVKVQVS